MYKTIVIGGGQAGLAAGYYLKKYGLSFLILEAGPEAVGSWPHYYDSLKLFSPAKYSSLPGFPFSGGGNRYPSRDEVISYLREYASKYNMPVKTNTRVEKVEKFNGRFQVTTTSGEILEAESVISATGSFHRPYIPDIPGLAAFRGEVIHSSAYRNTKPYQGQRVIVVGSGNSAVQIGVELSEVATTTLAVRTPVKLLPQVKFGRDLHFWLIATGLDKFPFPLFGRPVPEPTTVIDSAGFKQLLESGKPNQRPMFTSMYEDGVIWGDGEKESADAIIFATGFRPNLSFLAGLNALDDRGFPKHRVGVSNATDGLYFVGISGQRSFASATLRGVGDDARYVVRKINNA
ncbi:MULTISPECIES: NAD(P)-binding domain-containing protein [unclassified Paenibacillus]|uniref:NAD(P)-binding domain-containing protein n=1 Tax=unclassified Paenibacillus TaxID=185978 RepID=UPI00070971FF|nr:MULTISPECIES: NAD(P)-binding domain-containing protein [unclassified Paenibacillus]KQX67236.1 monooxygenase [Paenibacillus sp. Root444D2]KRE49998.1 monooxygenase [Paenibacillus sp. Soil724D2]